jgi:hypothetical protein
MMLLVLGVVAVCHHWVIMMITLVMRDACLPAQLPGTSRALRPRTAPRPPVVYTTKSILTSQEDRWRERNTGTSGLKRTGSHGGCCCVVLDDDDNDDNDKENEEEVDDDDDDDHDDDDVIMLVTSRD